MCLSLSMTIIRNNVHSIYSSFFLIKNIKLFRILYIFLNIYIEILAESHLYKCLKAIKSSECRLGTLQIFFTLYSLFNENGGYSKEK